MPVTTPAETVDKHFVSSWFGVELDNGIQGFFSEVGGLAIEIEVIESTLADTDTMTRKRPGTTKYTELTMKRTLSPNQDFWLWAKQIRDGDKDYRTDGAVVLYDMAGDEQGRWTFTNSWPSKWSASDLDVGSDDLMQEDITLQVELLKRES